MEETVEKILTIIEKQLSGYDYGDQYWILNEVCERAKEMAFDSLQMEYFNTAEHE